MYSHQLITGVSFGLTSGVITTLGMIVGLYSATSSKLAVVAAIIVMAIAGGLADAVGLHMAEETEIEGGDAKHTQKEVWFTTLFTFLSDAGSILTFAVPVLLFPLKSAVFVAGLWGIFLLTASNFYVAKVKSEDPVKLVINHLLLAFCVVIISYWIGALIPQLF